MNARLRPTLPFCLILAAASPAACSPDKDPLDSVSATAGGPSGDPSGSPGSGDPTGDPGGTSSATSGATSGATGGATTGGSEHGECDQFLLCVAAVDPGALSQAEESYGPNSSCWQLTPEIEQMCKDACAAGLDAYGMQYPDEPACGGSPGTTSTSDSGPFTTGPGTTGTSETGTTTGGSGFGNCGWDGTNSYYACGFMGEDPNGTHAIACPQDLPQSGAACDEQGPITSIGCCTPGGDNYYCGSQVIVIENCGA